VDSEWEDVRDKQSNEWNWSIKSYNFGK
jgi:hypothetical protein